MYLLPSAGKTWQSQVTVSFVLAHDWSKTCLLWLVIAVQNKFFQTYLSQIDHGKYIFIFSADEPERPKPPNVKIATNWKLEQLLSQWTPFQVTLVRDNQVKFVIQLLWSQRAIHLIALCSLAFGQADLIAYAVVETLLTSSLGSDKAGSRNLGGTKAGDEEFQIGETREAKIQRG